MTDFAQLTFWARLLPGSCSNRDKSWPQREGNCGEITQIQQLFTADRHAPLPPAETLRQVPNEDCTPHAYSNTHLSIF